MKEFKKLIQKNRDKFSTILPQLRNKEDFYKIDLADGNPELESITYDNVTQFAIYIEKKIKENNKTVAYGGYLEDRDMYKRSKIFKMGSEYRSIHLGVDFWVAEDTVVSAPLDGEIHSFAINAGHGDYGGTVILKHWLDGVTFYTLYGHLSHQSIENKSIGQHVTSGQEFAWIGSPVENGYWPPHLHFQVMNDMLSYEGDFPGVCTPNNIEYFKKICPNPLLMIGLE